MFRLFRTKSGIAVSISTGRLIGSCSSENYDFGLDALNVSENNEPELATHVMVFMVRGMMNKLNVPFIWYLCKSMSAVQLYNVVWKSKRALEDLGLKVTA